MEINNRKANYDYEIIETYKADENYTLFAKKGQIAERFEITDEIRRAITNKADRKIIRELIYKSYN